MPSDSLTLTASLTKSLTRYLPIRRCRLASLPPSLPSFHQVAQVKSVDPLTNKVEMIRTKPSPPAVGDWVILRHDVEVSAGERARG